jgi:DNA-binding NtrC family response regulator
MAHVLIVDDDRGMHRTLTRQLKGLGHTAESANDADSAIQAIQDADYDVVITDVRMPGRDGIELCQQLYLVRPDIPVVAMTGYGTLDMAVSAIRAGAWDFLRKPFDSEALELALHRALRHRVVKQELHRLRRATGEARGPAGLVGESPQMRALFERIERAAPTSVSVLILGPSGVGKERVARALHQSSLRSNGPFVAINCAASPGELVESELFGHEAGAFTGAGRAREGVFRAASGGTLFLDEVGELPASVQARLLRALEERRVRPVGRDRELPVDVRVLAATNVDLAEAVRKREFREDLYYRLKVLTLRVPPLRERGDDVLLLAADLLEEHGAISGQNVQLDPAFEDALLQWSWPGNVRELKNVLEASSALSVDNVLRVEHLPEEMRRSGPPELAASVEPTTLPSLDEVERRHVLRVIRATDGNRSQAARILGIDRKTLLSRLRRYGTDD